nr:MAG TPA: hypothetical protein [Caudoviricetes sp.]
MLIIRQLDRISTKTNRVKLLCIALHLLYI